MNRSCAVSRICVEREMENWQMQRANLNFTKFHLGGLALFVTAAVLLTVSFPVLSLAQQKAQKTFSSGRNGEQCFRCSNCEKR